MKKFLKYAAIAMAIIVAASLGTGYAFYYKISHSPDKPSVADVFRDMKTLSRIRFADGETACEVGSERRVMTILDKVSPIAQKAFLAVEDEKFYSHNGVNYKAIVRAAWFNLKNRGKGQQGASTITQQVVKNLLLSPERTLKRKIMEAVLAIELEEYLTEKLGSKKAAKDKILEIYLNWVNFGGGRYGIESASQDFFGKPASQLNLAEAIALASLPKSPSKYSLRTKKGNLANAERRKHVLNRMVAAKWISEGEKASALSATLVLVPRKTEAAEYSQEICDAGKKALRAKHCPGMDEKSAKDRLACELKISSLGTAVDSTINRKLQEFTHQALESTRNAIAKRHAKNGIPVAAAVAIRNETGEVLALASSPYAAGGLNYCFARRQVGSTFKPIVYGCGFQNRVMSPDSVFVDEESYLDPHHPEKVWPKNYEPKFMGAVNVRTALAHSVNTVAVQAAVRIGPGNVANFAHRLGISSEIALGPSIALGVSDISPLEMAAAYSVFARRGTYLSPKMFIRVNGETAMQESHQAMSPYAADQTMDIMAAVINEGTGRRVIGKLPVPSYGKTGTTSAHTDAWFGLMTKDYTVMVWVGHETRKSLGGTETGASAALPAALDIMHFLYKGKGAGAVYSMPTKAVDDSNIIEGEDIVEEEVEEEGDIGDGQGSSAKTTPARSPLQDMARRILHTSPKSVENEEQDEGQLEQDPAQLYQDPAPLLEGNPGQLYQDTN